MTRSQSTPDTALELMEQALRILDESGVSAEIGAHLDLAIERLYSFLGQERRTDEQDVA